VVYAPGGMTPAQKEAFTTFYKEQTTHLAADIAAVGKPIPNPAGDVYLIQVIPKTGPDDPATTALIGRIRTVVAEGQREYGLDTYITGQTALNIDTSAKLSSALPAYLAIIIVLCLIVLILVFRSLLVPITAVIGYVLSILAALGAVTFVFQEGHLTGVFGIAAPGPVLSFLPIILLGILFGLAMDYEVFLVSRMREESLHKDATTAVTDGYTDSTQSRRVRCDYHDLGLRQLHPLAGPHHKVPRLLPRPRRPDRRLRHPHDGRPGHHVHLQGRGLVAAALDAARPAGHRHRGGQARRAGTAAHVSSAALSGGPLRLLRATIHAMPWSIWKTRRTA
jgi:hypothetical protein